MPKIKYNEHIYPMEGRIIKVNTNIANQRFEFQKTYLIQPAVVGIVAVAPNAAEIDDDIANINVFFTGVTMNGATINTSIPYNGLVHVHVQGTKL